MGKKTVVAVSGALFISTDFPVDCIWRLYRCQSFYLFHFLMKIIKENKEIIIQLLVFSAMGWYFHKTWLFYFVGFLLLLLAFPAARKKYISSLNTILSVIGDIIKTILFSFLFSLVIIPIGFLLQKRQRSALSKKPYIETSGETVFTKPW